MTAAIKMVISGFLLMHLACPVKFVSDDKQTALKNSPEVQNLSFFSDEDSVKIVDGVPAIKLSEFLDKYQEIGSFVDDR